MISELALKAAVVAQIGPPCAGDLISLLAAILIEVDAVGSEAAID